MCSTASWMLATQPRAFQCFAHNFISHDKMSVAVLVRKPHCKTRCPPHAFGDCGERLLVLTGPFVSPYVRHAWPPIMAALFSVSVPTTPILIAICIMRVSVSNALQLLLFLHALFNDSSFMWSKITKASMYPTSVSVSHF